MNQILSCDWLPERAGWSYLARLGLPALPPRKISRKPYNKSFIDQACSVKMAGYWPRSFFASLWTSTPSRSINSQRKNLTNIQPYILTEQAWSITHIYFNLTYARKPSFFFRHWPFKIVFLSLSFPFFRPFYSRHF